MAIAVSCFKATKMDFGLFEFLVAKKVGGLAKIILVSPLDRGDSGHYKNNEGIK